MGLFRLSMLDVTLCLFDILCVFLAYFGLFREIMVENDLQLERLVATDLGSNTLVKIGLIKTLFDVLYVKMGLTFNLLSEL